MKGGCNVPFTARQDQIIEIRWHGRGGQGAVTSAELVAHAAIGEGQYAQAMPSFGPERRGAPVLAYNRVSLNTPIRTRAPVMEPDIVVVLEPGLLTISDVTTGLKENGTIVINSTKNVEDLITDIGCTWRLAVINGTSIAKELLGVPIVNTTMIGALIKASGIIKLESLEEPIKERFGAKAMNNINACKRAYDEVVINEPANTVIIERKKFASEILPKWQDILPGNVIVDAGNASAYRTGDWKSQHTEFDYKKCIKCGLCYIFCPEGCIEPAEDGYYKANDYYCKGCGICAKECPKNVITMIEES